MKQLFSSVVRYSLAASWLLTGSPLIAQEASHSVSVDAPSVTKLSSAWRLTDYRGKEFASDTLQGKIHVVAFLGTECPLAKHYSTRLEQLQQDFSDAGVTFVGIDSNEQDSLQDMDAFARRQKLSIPLLKDPDGAVAAMYGATRTPEVFLVDAQGAVRYSGRIDDQYVIGNIRPAAEHEDLRVAIHALLENGPVLVSKTQAIGCLIGRRRQEVAPTTITFSKDIAPLFQARCVDCHHAGDIGPMSLDNYADVAAWSEMILEVVNDRRMPPWHANPHVGQFANDRSLSADELALINDWVKGGCPEGDSRDLPAAKKYTAGWQLPREPDVVFQISDQPFVVPATGEVKYQYFSVDPKFTEDKWVQAAELLPGNRAVVHHILVFARNKNEPNDIAAERSYLAGYVPGTRFKPYPAGMAKKVAAGSELIFQVHYTPIGTEQADLSKLGFIFADPATITHEVQTTSVVQPHLRIAANDPAWETSAYLPEELPMSQLVCMSPHMHLRGKSFSYELITPDGKRQMLLDVPQYDFNWQTAYELVDRIEIAAGSRMFCRAVYDNSVDNIYNPNPDQEVRWGDQTDDEMMIGYFDIAIPLNASGDTSARAGQMSQEDVRHFATFLKWDQDGNGALEKNELPSKYRKFFSDADRDKDAALDKDEFIAAAKRLSK